MRVLFISDLWLPFPGGAERYVVNMAKETAKRGHEVWGLTGYLKGSNDGIKCLVMRSDIGVRNDHAKGVAAITEEVARINPDVIVIQHFYAYEFAHEIVALGKPVVQMIHNKHRIDGVKLAIYSSQYTMDHSNPAAEDFVVHPMVDDSVLTTHIGEKIGFIKPIDGKGIAFIYDLAARMSHRQFLILRGEWYTIEDIREMPNVEFMQPVKDMRDFYQYCRIVLMPSKSEDAGTVPQEAAANGLPCITTPVMGLLETNAHGIILPQNLVRWADEIDRLFNDVSYHTDIAVRQKGYLDSFQWASKLDTFCNRLQELV